MRIRKGQSCYWFDCDVVYGGVEFRLGLVHSQKPQRGGRRRCALPKTCGTAKTPSGLGHELGPTPLRRERDTMSIILILDRTRRSLHKAAWPSRRIRRPCNRLAYHPNTR
jgi:hypothetical protein